MHLLGLVELWRKTSWHVRVTAEAQNVRVASVLSSSCGEVEDGEGWVATLHQSDLVFRLDGIGNLCQRVDPVDSCNGSSVSNHSQFLRSGHSERLISNLHPPSVHRRLRLEHLAERYALWVLGGVLSTHIVVSPHYFIFDAHQLHQQDPCLDG